MTCFYCNPDFKGVEFDTFKAESGSKFIEKKHSECAMQN